MRGKLPAQSSMFYAIDVESRLRTDHPLRPIKRIVDEELATMSGLFEQAYMRDNGRPSVPPERLLKALLLQCLYSIRSETQLIERIDTDLLFRWFLDMDPAQDALDQATFTHNCPRLEQHGIIAAFFDGVVRRAMKAGADQRRGLHRRRHAHRESRVDQELRAQRRHRRRRQRL